jgi:hypothetical protein
MSDLLYILKQFGVMVFFMAIPFVMVFLGLMLLVP